MASKGTKPIDEEDCEEYIPRVEATTQVEDLTLSSGTVADAETPEIGQSENDVLPRQPSKSIICTPTEDNEINQETRLSGSGVPHGGLSYADGTILKMENTCPLDQFVNGLMQIVQFLPIRKWIERNANLHHYSRLWNTIRFCDEKQYAPAKFNISFKRNLYGEERELVRPLLEGQLHIKVDKNIKYDYSTGFQGVLAEFKHQSTGTTSKLQFETGEPPLIIAVDMSLYDDVIPINYREIVNQFGRRYVIYLVSVFNIQGTGHYMSYVFKPDKGENVDVEGRLVGNWYWYPNDEIGSMDICTPGLAHPLGSKLSYVYLIMVPSSSATCQTSYTNYK